MTPINLFTIIPANFFTPLTSKHKQTYVDCLELIYDSYKSELSFGVDKEVIVSKLEDYFDQVSGEEMVFEEEDTEVAADAQPARGTANMLSEPLECSSDEGSLFHGIPFHGVKGTQQVAGNAFKPDLPTPDGGVFHWDFDFIQGDLNDCRCVKFVGD
ncbi:MAG: hypothetical protein SCK57_03695 [Bacillota bacterium]|nr:hypothetical protein [Bacillota bacterium]MDW7676742.1 hypothetical protein [Bacillota bacterium]